MFWNNAGIFYSSAGKSSFVKRVQKAFISRIEELNLPAGSKALDAGCGDGNITVLLARRGFNVTGIDFGRSVLARAEKRCNKIGLTETIFEYGDLNNPLKYSDGSFDLVISCHVLMKVKNIDSALKDFHRVLKPGGYAVLSITSSDEIFSSWFGRYIKKHGLIKAFWDARWLIAWGVPYVLMTKKVERRDEWRWSTDELAKHLEEAGFSTVMTEDVPYTHVGFAMGVFRKDEK